MKIMVAGYSGSGKSTLSRKLALKYEVPVLHLDRVQFLPNWQERPLEEKRRIVSDFLAANPEGWVIDGNYSALSYEQRAEEADRIVLMLFGRWNCLYRCARRYRTYSGKTRPDMADGCEEKLDREFIRWILRGGRTKETRERYRQLQLTYPDKVTVLKDQRQLNAWLKQALF